MKIYGRCLARRMMHKEYIRMHFGRNLNSISTFWAAMAPVSNPPFIKKVFERAVAEQVSLRLELYDLPERIWARA